MFHGIHEIFLLPLTTLEILVAQQTTRNNFFIRMLKTKFICSKNKTITYVIVNV